MDETTVLKRFHVHSHYQWTVNQHSYEYKVLKVYVHKLMLDGKVMFVVRKRNMLTYKLLVCYPSNVGKKHCIIQCDACKLIQLNKQNLAVKINEIQGERAVKKMKNPSKLSQILEILKR